MASRYRFDAMRDDPSALALCRTVLEGRLARCRSELEREQSELVTAGLRANIKLLRDLIASTERDVLAPTMPDPYDTGSPAVTKEI